MDNTYSGHFNSSRRFVYAWILEPVEGHIRYLVGCVFNTESLYYIDYAFDSGNGNYAIGNLVDMDTLYPVELVDNNEGYYRIQSSSDTGGLYNIITCGDFNS